MHNDNDSSELARIPHVLSELGRYLRFGVRPEMFLEWVLCNDLFKAMAYADENAQRALPALVRYIYNGVPRAAWGGREDVERWLTDPKFREDVMAARDAVLRLG